MSFFAELKRRNVFKVGIAYALMGWVLLQAADFALDLVAAPNWVIQALVIVIIIGLPIALFFAWAYELTPEGIKRESDVDRTQSITPQTGRKLDYAIIGFLALVITLMGVERVFFAKVEKAEKGSEPFSSQAETGLESEKGSDPISAAVKGSDPIKSIAVLPFVNMSPDPDNEYFADGISEEILNVLTGVPDLKVTARTSAFSFRNSGATIAEIAAKLGVAHILEGSVRKSGNRVRVTAQLIRSEGEFHLWSETYDRQLDDIFTVQDEIARAIVAALQLSLTSRQQMELVQPPTQNLEAYNLYLKGRQLWHQRGQHSLLSSVELLKQAVSLDPQFAEAWAALADAAVLVPEYSPDRDIREFVPLARDASNRALELQPENAQALTARAYIRFMYDYDYNSAEQDFLRAIEMDPGYPTARQWYGEFLAVVRRDTEGALEHFRTAADLDPLAHIMWHVSAFVAGQVGRYEESLGYYRRVLDMAPDFAPAWINLAYQYAEMGEYEASREAIRRVAALTGRDMTSMLDLANALENPLLKPARLEHMAVDPAVIIGAINRAYEYMLLGEPELAIDDLEQALAQGSPYATYANRIRIYDSLRDNPRFQAYLAKLNLWPPGE